MSKGKSIAKNYIYNLSYQVLIMILPLVTTPYVSRVLGAQGLGTFSYTNSITQYFILFGAIGLNLYGQREIAYSQNDKKKYSKVFFELVIIRAITLTISVIAFYFLLCKDNKYSVVFLIQTIDVIASIFDISWLFQGLEDFKKIVIRNFIVKITGVCMIFLFIKSSDNLSLYVFLNSATLLLGNLSMWLYLPKTVQKINIHMLELKKHIHPAISLFIPQIATSLYTMLDKTMIGFLTGNESEVAFYEQAQKIVKIFLTVVTSLGTVMMPRIARTFAENDNEKISHYMSATFKIVSVLSFPLCIGLMAVTNHFVPWFFGDGYDKVVPNMILIAPILIFISMSNVTGTQFLLPTHRQKEYTISVVAGSVINVIFNVILIPLFASLGAAAATLIAELSVTGVQFYFVRNDFDLKIIFKNMLKYIIFSIIMAIVVILIGLNMSGSVVTTVIQIVVGGAVYIGLLFISKDEILMTILRKVKR